MSLLIRKVQSPSPAPDMGNYLVSEETELCLPRASEGTQEGWSEC